MTYSAKHVKSLKKLIGDETPDPVEYILTEARNGSFSQNEAERFADNLHPEAYGALINSRIVFGGEAMELILSFWFERGEVFKLTKDEALCKLISALKEARKAEIAYKIQEMCMGSQDTTEARAGIPVTSNNSPSVNQPSAPTKVVTRVLNQNKTIIIMLSMVMFSILALQLPTFFHSKTPQGKHQVMDLNQPIRKQVEKRLGPSYEILLAAIRTGDIVHDQVQGLGYEMGGSVNSIYVAQMRQNTELVQIFKQMMDCWFKETSFSSQDEPLDALITILEKDSRMNHLVSNMKKVH